jgi:hypothetical protein
MLYFNFTELEKLLRQVKHFSVLKRSAMIVSYILERFLIQTVKSVL